MKKILPWAASALAGVGIAVALYFFVLAPDRKDDPPVGDAAPAQPFDPAAFLDEFDANGDGTVDRAEFDTRYGTGEFAFSGKDGKPLPRDQAFRALDTNGNDKIDGADLKLLGDRRWREHQQSVVKRGLLPREWKGRLLALNLQQVELYEDENGSEVRDELAFAGRRFHSRYFGQWSEIKPKQGSSFSGFVADVTATGDKDAEGRPPGTARKMALVPGTRIQRVPYDEQWEKQAGDADRIQIHEWAAPIEGGMIEGLPFSTWGKVFKGGARSFEYEGFIRREKDALLIAQSLPRLMVVGEATVTPQADAPYQQYVQALRTTPFEDVSGNLELARRCRAWGLHDEARTLYMRVICFEPDNSEALDYWGITVKDGQFSPRKR